MAKKPKLKKKLIQQTPTTAWENKFIQKGFQCIAGIDEAGRGPLAGPVVAACVVLKKFDFQVRIDDSKKLTSSMRDRAYGHILKNAFVGIGACDETTIEQININKATILAMRKALFNLPVRPDFLLIDGILDLKVPLNYKCIIGGDRLSLSIAAASIVAKVTRDRMMLFFHKIFPEWQLSKHKGYGTKEHFTAIKKHGLSPLHRKSFII